jgi:hypothetical protein
MGEAHTLTRKAIDLAKQGDSTALRPVKWITQQVTSPLAFYLDGLRKAGLPEE